MGVVASLVDKDLVDLTCQVSNVEEFFARTSATLFQMGLVKASFCEAIQKREQEYPTGLQLEHMAIAIPHTLAQHVEKPFIFINKLVETSLEFIQMGTDDVVVHPRFIFILGIKEPKEQLTLLAELMEVFSQKQFVEALEHAQSSQEILMLFQEK